MWKPSRSMRSVSIAKIQKALSCSTCVQMMLLWPWTLWTLSDFEVCSHFQSELSLKVLMVFGLVVLGFENHQHYSMQRLVAPDSLSFGHFWVSRILWTSLHLSCCMWNSQSHKIAARTLESGRSRTGDSSLQVSEPEALWSCGPPFSETWRFFEYLVVFWRLCYVFFGCHTDLAEAPKHDAHNIGPDP